MRCWSQMATKISYRFGGAKFLVRHTPFWSSDIRSFMRTGGLAGWIVWPKPTPLAPLELTIEVPGRISSSGAEVRPFDPTLLD